MARAENSEEATGMNDGRKSSVFPRTCGQLHHREESHRATGLHREGLVKGLGSAQIVLGISLVSFGGFLFADLSIAASTGTPWWSGFPLIIAGSLTISSENRKTNKTLAKFSFGMNIITCVLIGFSILILSFDVVVTVIFALVYRYWILSFLMKIAFLVYLVAALGISITVLVIEHKLLTPEDKGMITMRSVQVVDSASNTTNVSHCLE